MLQGFRVTIAAPDDGPTKIGRRSVKISVKVQVHRRDGLASQWGNYTSIEVSLRNRNAER